ncbi:MAG: hypothetical protein MUC29_14425, partial [Pyrinomonadaceae bacterium]|nr:hypothetical protein [Pyrinomonadaceae bacterium]
TKKFNAEAVNLFNIDELNENLDVLKKSFSVLTTDEELAVAELIEKVLFIQNAEKFGLSKSCAYHTLTHRRSRINEFYRKSPASS